jgi:ferredoxin/flavodoxin
MKTVIYYFSATGNSLVVARDLAAELGNAELVPITKALESAQNYSYDMLGIIFPVYMFGLPLIVKKFLKNLKTRDNAYFFAVATLGGLPGRALTMVKDILKKRKVRLAAGFSVLMPGNYTPLYGAIDSKRQMEMFEREKSRIKEIALYLRQQKQGIIEEKPFLINFLLYKLLYHLGSMTIPASDKGFWFSEACIKCGLCGKVCPVANIEMRGGHPAWLHHCQHCMACLQWCPTEAIEYGKKTEGRRRYHHPEVSAEDIAQQKQ